MASRNRRNRRTDNYISPSCPPGWAWLLAGIMIGMFISFLIYLREIAPHTVSPEANVATVTNNEQVIPTPLNGQPLEDPEHQFQFFGDSPNTPPPAETTQPPSQPPSKVEQHSDLPITVPGRYLLQVGSFRDEREAEGLKTHLASIGIPARIEPTMLNESGRWYRVQVGPFTDLDKLNQIRAQLAANSLSFLLLKF